MLVRLKESGAIFDHTAREGDSEGSIERRAMLVYEGKFESMDGPVSVTRDQLKRLVESHNSLLGKVKRLASGEVPLKNYPPVQADHSTSAWDTIGRVIGEIELGDYENDEGETVQAVFGNVRFLGKDNVERVKDGRWTHLSVGADFEKSKLSELTVTPFPAAANASLLKDGNADKSKKESSNEGGNETMDRAKLKKYLMDCKKMSSEDADKELDRLSSEEAKEELSKLSAEEDEHAKKLSAEQTEAEEKEKKETEAKLTAARAEITKLSTDFRANLDTARLAASKGRIMTRLSKLRAEAKVTPAEIKKMDITKLASSSQEAIDAVLKTYEDREPVISTGQLGSTKSEDLSAVQAKVRMSRLEAETRANMPLLKRMDDHRRLAEGEGAPIAQAEVPALEPAPTISVEAEFSHICSMIDQGNAAGAKEALRQLLTKLSAGGASEANETNVLETENQLSALSGAVENMQKQFDSIVKLSSSLVG